MILSNKSKRKHFLGEMYTINLLNLQFIGFAFQDGRFFVHIRIRGALTDFATLVTVHNHLKQKELEFY